MSNELAIILAIVGALGTVGGIVFGIISASSNRSKKDKDEATRTAIIETKLDLMLNGVNEIRDDLKAYKNELQNHKNTTSEAISAIKLELTEVRSELARVLGISQETKNEMDEFKKEIKDLVN